MPDLEIRRSERVLIAVFLFMMAIIIGYNAFYTKPAITSENLTSENTYENQEKSQTDESPESSIINLNVASESELQNLKGVGPVIAKRIIKYRNTHGGFANIEEIKNIKGIGKKFFEKIKGNICV